MENAGIKRNAAEFARKAERDARLSLQLRANLKRRKAAARSRGEGPEAEDNSADHPAADAAPPARDKQTP